uniref:Suppressor of RPS4-RLD 1 isoform X1 n=1 Tax=Rhizophora mucronata TaxID=61149 RepID=A0A2P2MBW2_RHIMU
MTALATSNVLHS